MVGQDDTLAESGRSGGSLNTPFVPAPPAFT